MLFGLDCSGNGIEDLTGSLLILRVNVASVNALKHHFELFPTLTCGLFFLCINVEGNVEVDDSGGNFSTH